MADTFTTNLNLTKPEPGAAEDTWGISLNADLDALDAIFSSSGTQINLNPNQINFGDNKKAIFGAGGDLEIFHTGSSSIIKDSGTGNLSVRGTHLNLADSGGNIFIEMTDTGTGGTVEIKHNAETKLTTTSTGIDVTGTATMDAAKVETSTTSTVTISESTGIGTAELRFVATDSFPKTKIVTDVSAASLSLETLGNDRLKIANNGDISFYDDTGTSQNLKWDASADTLNFVDNAKATFGAGSDLEIYHDGSNSFIKDVGSGDLIIQGSNAIRLRSSTGENMAIFNADGAATLQYDNSTKLQTTSTGIDVTGTVVADGLTVDVPSTQDIIFQRAGGVSGKLELDFGAGFTNFNSANDGFKFYHNGTQLMQMRFGDISFYNTAGTSQALYWDGSAESLFIGATSASALNSFSDDLIISNTASGTGAGISIVSNATNGYSSIHFGDTDDADIGRIQYNNATNVMTFRTNAADRGVIDSSGNFGIGTTSPQNNSGRTTLTISNSTNGGILEIFGASDTRQLLIYNTTGESRFETLSGGSEDLVFRPNGSESMRIDSSGNVGIGTTSPDYKLTIGDATDSAGTDLLSLEGGGYLTRFRNNSDVTLMFTNTTKGIAFGTGGTSGEKMRIDSSGNVGIGTSSPNYPLTVHHTGDGIKFEISDLVDADYRIQVSGNDIITGPSTGSDYIFQTSNAERMRIDSNGNVGIGTTSPNRSNVNIHGANRALLSATSQLAITTSDAVAADIGGSLHFGAHYDTSADFAPTAYIAGRRENATTNSFAGYLQFGVIDGGATTIEAMRIDSSGNVGIGTDSPSALLHLQSTGDTIARVTSADGNTALLDLGDVSDPDGGRIFYDSGSNLGFTTASTERMRIDSSGNLLVGTTSSANTTDGVRITSGGYITIAQDAASVPTLYLNKITNDGQYINFQKDGTEIGSIGTGGGDLNIGTGDTRIRFNDVTDNLIPLNESNGYRDNAISLGDSLARFKDLYLGGTVKSTTGLELTDGTSIYGNVTESNGSLTLNARNTGILLFQSGGNEKARFDAFGNFMVGKTSIGVATTGSEIRSNGQVSIVREGDTPLFINRKTDDGTIVDFRKDGSVVGTISVTSSATTYNTSSDARLKDVTGQARGLDVINVLNPVSYNWKADGKADEGLIAQEVLDVVPNAVSQNEDEYYQMDYSKLVVHLVKGMKEQQEQIESLKSEIANLKGE